VSKATTGAATSFTYRLLRYTTTSTWTSVDLPGVAGTSGSADGSIVAWIGTDGRPRVAPTPHGADQPRALGGAVTTGTVPTSGLGKLELPPSAQLTACSVKINAGATLVRTLSCDPSRAQGGTVYVAWDGKNASGVLQPAGTYAFTVVASNADGALLTPAG